MQDQDEFITRNANFEDVALVTNDKAILEDIGFKKKNACLTCCLVVVL